MRISTPGKLVLLKKSKTRGMTLIEIMVAMAIVGLIFVAAVSGLRTVFNINLKKSASQLASTIRFLSNKAVTDQLYLRMIFDFGNQTYRVEESREIVVINPAEEIANPAGEEKGKEKTSTLADKEQVAPPSTFSASESELLKPTKLPGDVFFKDILVSYLPEKKSEGQVAIYFFPDGFATPAIINLRNEDDDEHFSLELKALSGRVKILGEYRDGFSEGTKNE